MASALTLHLLKSQLVLWAVCNQYTPNRPPCFDGAACCPSSEQLQTLLRWNFVHTPTSPICARLAGKEGGVTSARPVRVKRKEKSTPKPSLVTLAAPSLPQASSLIRSSPPLTLSSFPQSQEWIRPPHLSMRQKMWKHWQYLDLWRRTGPVSTKPALESAYLGMGVTCNLIPGCLFCSASVIWGGAGTCSLSSGERQDFLPDSMSLASSSMGGIVVLRTKESEVIPVYTRSRRKATFSNLVISQNQHNEITATYMMISLRTQIRKKRNCSEVGLTTSLATKLCSSVQLPQAASWPLLCPPHLRMGNSEHRPTPVSYSLSRELS